MLNVTTERDHLAKAEREIAEGEQRVRRQAALVEHLRSEGLRTGEAQRLLTTLDQTLATWRDHRDEILRTIARLEGKQT